MALFRRRAPEPQHTPPKQQRAPLPATEPLPNDFHPRKGVQYNNTPARLINSLLPLLARFPTPPRSLTSPPSVPGFSFPFARNNAREGKKGDNPRLMANNRPDDGMAAADKGQQQQQQQQLPNGSSILPLPARPAEAGTVDVTAAQPDGHDASPLPASEQPPPGQTLTGKQEHCSFFCVFLHLLAFCCSSAFSR